MVWPSVAWCKHDVSMQDHLRRASQVSSALESRLRQEGRAEAQAQAQAQMQALKQGRAEAQAAAQKQIQALLQERDDLQVHTLPCNKTSQTSNAQLADFVFCTAAATLLLKDKLGFWYVKASWPEQ